MAPEGDRNLGYIEGQLTGIISAIKDCKKIRTDAEAELGEAITKLTEIVAKHENRLTKNETTAKTI